MPRGANAKREREYDELKQRFKSNHRYLGREEEVAARIVNKQRRIYGETKAEKRKDREGRSPDRDLPIERYQHLTVAQITEKLGRLSPPELWRLRAYEHGHKDRKGVMKAIHRALDK